MTHRLADIVSRLTRAPDPGSTVLVGIDGPGGSGKTALAAALAEALRSAGRTVAVVQFDDFFLPSTERPGGAPETRPVGADFDWNRLREEVLLPLRDGRAARYARYDWSRDTMADPCETAPGGTVIVEGVYCTRRELSQLYDVRVWVECPRAERLARGLRRDGEAARRRWELDWMPSEDRYVREQDPASAAHFVVRGESASAPHAKQVDGSQAAGTGPSDA